MKIISLVAENIKKIRAVEIRPAGPVVMITGKNGAGKIGVYIEDGEVAALDGVATEKEVADEKAV